MAKVNEPVTAFVKFLKSAVNATLSFRGRKINAPPSTFGRFGLEGGGAPDERSGHQRGPRVAEERKAAKQTSSKNRGDQNTSHANVPLLERRLTQIRLEIVAPLFTRGGAP